MTQVEKTHTRLDRDFQVVCLDWDGSVAFLLEEEVARMRSLIHRLCALGVDVAIVSESDVGEVDGRLHARPDAEGRLFLFLSGGSEIYVAGPKGPRLLVRRQASEEEEAALAVIVDALRESLAAAGVEIDVNYDGFNRWTIDADSIPAEADTLREARESASRLILEEGLDSVVTGEGGRITISHTGRSDKLRAVVKALIENRHREGSDLLVLGGESFLLCGSEPDDLLARVPPLAEATLVVTAADPVDAPCGSIRVGGGSDAVLRILGDQLSRRQAVARARFPEPIDDPAWRFEVQGFDPFREREIETLLTVANGETGTRGALEEGSAVSTPTTFVAGVFGDGTGEPRFRQPVPAPDWAGLRLVVGGVPLGLSNGEVIRHERILDMRHGVLYRFWRQRDGSGRTVFVRTARFASLADRSVMAIRAEATAEDFDGRLIWQGAVGISHAGGAIRETEIQTLDGPRLLARTAGRNGGGHVLALTTKPAEGSAIVRYLEQGRDVIGGRLEPGDPATVDRIAAIVSARTRVPSSDAAGRTLARAERLGYDELLRRHRAAWDERWQDADVIVGGDDSDQQALRFSIFHMIATAHPTKDTVSVGARGLSGMSYFLHVFWDTEIFVLPFFIYTHPETARTLLAYRYRHLAGAREKARQMGHRGALYPWESADKGVETTPPYGFGPEGEIIPILSGLMEHHISADVAWAVWEYWKGSADDEFMASMGVEIMLETARFWASRADRDDEGRYHIHLVVGPDEYHEGIDDNAYTNVLARWNITRAMEAWQWLEKVDSGYAEELHDRLELSEDEFAEWRDVCANLVDGYDPETLLYEQFAGFYEMDDIPLEKLRPRPMAADLMLGREVTLNAKVVKQADVVMLTHVLSDEIDDAVTSANYDYYEPITSHGSSLSPGMHAAVAARLGRIDDAVADFKMATAIDLGDNMGNAARGLHLATMGSLWQAAVLGFAGIQRRNESLLVDPHLPPGWDHVSVPLVFRGARLRFEYHQREGELEMGIEVRRAPVFMIIDGAEREVLPGTYRFRRRDKEVWREVAT